MLIPFVANAGEKFQVETETAISVFPEYSISDDGLVIAILYLKEEKSGRSLTLATSNNGGQSWNSLSSIAKKVSPFNFKVAVSKDGKDISAIWIEDGLDNGIWIKNSKDGGKSWSQDKLILTPNARGKNRLQLSQSRDGGTKLITYFASSLTNSSLQTFFQNATLDAGQTWLFTNNGKDDIQQPYGDSRVSDDGRLLAYTYESYGNKSTQGQLRFSISNDGLNWSPETTIDTGDTFSPHSRIVKLGDRQLVINYDNSNSLLVSRDNGRNFQKLKLPFSGFLKNLWINEDLSRIYVSNVDSASNGRIVSFSASFDSGITWQKPVKVVDGVDNESSLVVSRDGKTIAMLTTSWGKSSLFLQMSNDLGRTWSSPHKINSIDETVRIAFDGQRFGTHLDESGSKVVVLFNAFNSNNSSYSQTLLKIPYYSVEFDGNGQTSGSVPGSLISLDGAPITFPAKPNDFMKRHFSFLGWSKERNSQTVLYLPGQVLSGISSNSKVYAQWKELPSFEINFYSNSVLKQSPSQMKIWEDSPEAVPYVSKDLVVNGFEFINWSTEPSGKGLLLQPGQNISSFYYSNKLSGVLNIYAIGRQLPVKSNEPSTARKTIVCVKGKSTTKVTAINPKCPKGYKRK